MKHTYSIAERNRIVEEHLWCIDTIIKQNRALMIAAHLDRDDVYQQLSIRLIRAVENFDPEKGDLRQHIFAQLKYELLNCKRPHRLHGMTGLPGDFRHGSLVSINALSEYSPIHQQLIAA